MDLAHEKHHGSRDTLKISDRPDLPSNCPFPVTGYGQYYGGTLEMDSGQELCGYHEWFVCPQVFLNITCPLFLVFSITNVSHSNT